MKKKILALGIFTMIFSSLTAANNLTLPSINLGGVTVNHSLEHPARGSISLKPLSDFTNDGTWNISCDFSVQETGGASAPSAADPLAAIIQLQAVGTITGDAYTNAGFIAQAGNFEIINTRMWYPANSIDFINYDTTGDLTVSNCIATLQLPA